MKPIPIVLGILMFLLTPSIYAHAQPINICIYNQAGLGAVTPLAIADAIQTQINEDLQQFYFCKTELSGPTALCDSSSQDAGR